MFEYKGCGHCKNMKKDYVDAAVDMKKFLPGTYLAALDGTIHSKTVAKLEVKGYPYLIYYESGSFKSQYNGARTKDAIVTFMRDGPKKDEL